MNFNSLSKVLFLNFDERNMKKFIVFLFLPFYCHSLPDFFFFKQREKNICMRKSEWPNAFETAALKGKEGGREKRKKKNILNKNNLLDIFLQKAF